MASQAIAFSEAAKRDFEEGVEIASELLNLDIGRIMLKGPVEELNDTRVAQPATLIASKTGATALRELLGRREDLDVGHSFGHIAALHEGGYLEFEPAIKLAVDRGEAMYAAAQENPGSMAAVFNITRAKIHEIAEKYGVSVANDNSDSEIIISGDDKGIKSAISAIKEAGGRAIPLKVKAAAHSPLVKLAADRMAHLVESIPIHIHQEDIHIPENLKVMSSRTVEYLKDYTDIKADIAGLTESVKWRQTFNRVLKEGYIEMYEPGPGTKLSKLPARAPIMRRKMERRGAHINALENMLDEMGIKAA